MATVKTDIAAIAMTANAKAVMQSKGVQINDLMQLLQTHAAEMQAIVRQVISLHPVGGEAANLTALNNILAELL